MQEVDKKMGGAFNIWKHGKCERKGVCYYRVRGNNVFPDSVLPRKQENGCFDQTTLYRKILREMKKIESRNNRSVERGFPK